MPRLNGQDVDERDFMKYVGKTLNGSLITEYPRMLYRAGAMPNATHDHHGVTLKVAGKYDVVTRTVTDEAEELEALEEGWNRSPEQAHQQAVKDAADAKAKGTTRAAA